MYIFFLVCCYTSQFYNCGSFCYLSSSWCAFSNNEIPPVNDHMFGSLISLIRYYFSLCIFNIGNHIILCPSMETHITHWVSAILHQVALSPIFSCLLLESIHVWILLDKLVRWFSDSCFWSVFIWMYKLVLVILVLYIILFERKLGFSFFT